MTSFTRHNNWSKECEDILNKQINIEIYASLQYQSISAYFKRDYVGLNEISKFFDKASLEEREHAQTMIEYQNKRGGRVIFTDQKEIHFEYEFREGDNTDVIYSFKKALQMEQDVYEHLLKVHKTTNNDPQFADFIESEFLSEQIDALYELGVYISELTRIGNDGHGIFEFNNKLNKTEGV